MHNDRTAAPHSSDADLSLMKVLSFNLLVKTWQLGIMYSLNKRRLASSSRYTERVIETIIWPVSFLELYLVRERGIGATNKSLPIVAKGMRRTGAHCDECPDSSPAIGGYITGSPQHLMHRSPCGLLTLQGRVDVRAAVIRAWAAVISAVRISSPDEAGDMHAFDLIHMQKLSYFCTTQISASRSGIGDDLAH
ncbi:uncharacterized protein LAESUDRAFT_720924 [Laetiporus sulphureus 93-53]|uniref:Uncharacterized protein n=1 Tax=Laetiporus sulphureus 93-53 TaxID=1314785 RepID=A0A165GNF2_9APHY|nr:uncharacterized protein LAESUDRAFT_720924 [Laetiporus sulphureus 93-53]KZT10588.1 hypothetical protein LAESUDRAFT_720924 [Laetiporus sulphureus 93-53]